MRYALSSVFVSLAALTLGACGAETTPGGGAVPGVDGGSVTDTGSPVVGTDTGSPVVAVDAGDPPSTGAVNWSEHVAPILFRHCTSCHRAGGIAPFALLTYADATQVAPLMARATAERRMPPTLVNASGSCQTFRGDVNWLSDAQISTIARWVAAGTPQGDPSRAPVPPPAPTGLERVDVRLDMGLHYSPIANRPDDYRCFLVDPGTTVDRYITGYEVAPGQPRIVHHMILYSLPTAAAQQTAERLDAEDSTPGYPCFGGPRVSGSNPLALWAPGVRVTQFPERSGLRLHGGRKVVMQIHYNLAGGAVPDRTVVNLQLSPSAVMEAYLVPILQSRLNLPPRMMETTATGNFTFPSVGVQSVWVWGTTPHMHTLGIRQRVTVVQNGQTVCLGDVPRWDFHWQQMNFYAEPVQVRVGEQLQISCTYNTMSRTSTTTWGEGTNDEMCLNYFYVTPFR